jgi:DNA-binding transcriptional LysR family regulator
MPRKSAPVSRVSRFQMDGAHLAAMRALVLAVDGGSLTGAAMRLGLTPSAVSKQLSRLEDALGSRLLERTTRRVRPTAAGLALIERARPLFEALDEAGADVRDLQTAVRGRVRISASRAFGRLCLLPLLAGLLAQHEDLQIDVVLEARRLDFIEDEIDLAVREGALEDSSLTVRRLGEAAVQLYASRAYLERRSPPRSVEDLRDHDLLAVPALRPETDISQLRGRQGRQLELVPRVRVNDLLAIVEVAEGGAGIVALPAYVAVAPVARGTLARVLPRTTLARFPVSVVYPSRRHLPQRIQVVLDLLRSEVPSMLH